MDSAYETHLQKYETAEAVVKQSITSSVPDWIFNQMKSKKSAKDIWDAITEIFESRSTMAAIDLRLKLQNIKCGTSEDVCAEKGRMMGRRRVRRQMRLWPKVRTMTGCGRLWTRVGGWTTGAVTAVRAPTGARCCHCHFIIPQNP